MPRPTRIEVKNISGKKVELVCSDTRSRTTIPPYATRKVYPSFLTHKPSTIIELYKIDPTVEAPEEEAPEPVVNARPVSKPKTVKIPEPEPEIEVVKESEQEESENSADNN